MISLEKQQVRQYLLGSLAQEEREQMELRLFLEDEFLTLVEGAEDDLIDDYVAGDLTEMERKRFERHFLCTPERQQKLQLIQALWRRANPKKEAERAEREGTGKKENLPVTKESQGVFRLPFAWKIAASVLLAVGLGLGVWRVGFYQSPAGQALASLKKAYAKERPIEARITDFDYAPFDSYRGNDQTIGDPLLKQRAERILLDANTENPSPENKAALGRFYLSEKKLEQAITRFTEALAATPGKAELQSDLGAAWLEQGKLHRLRNDDSKHLESFARSLEYLDQALQQKPGAKEALFNRALCYQYMKLNPQAIQEWKNYLQRDPNSEWAKEAQRNLALIEQEEKKTVEQREKLYQDFLLAHQNSDRDAAWQALRQSYTTRGNHIVERLLDKQLAENATPVASSLPLLIFAGGLAVERTQDYYWQDLAQFYQRLLPAQRVTIMLARQQLQEGNQVASLSRAEAIGHFEKALNLFRKARDECEAEMTRYLLGKTLLRQFDFQTSSTIFRNLAASPKKYKWLQCQAHYALADLQNSLSERSQAIHYSRQAYLLAEQIGDASLAVRTLSQLAEWDQNLGEKRRALVSLQRALVFASTTPLEAMERWILNFRLSANLADLGYVQAAIAYQREALRLAEKDHKPLQASRSYTYLGRLLGSQGKSQEAIQLLQQACAMGEELPDETMRKNILGYSLLRLAQQQREMGRLAEAQKNYSVALEINQQLGLVYANFTAVRGRLLTEIARQDDRAAQEDLQKALEVFEENRAKITEEANRSSYFDREQDIYDIAIDFAYPKDATQAFDYSETSRARSLLDLMRNGIKTVPAAGSEIYLAASAAPLTWREIQGQLPARTKIIQYATLNDHLLIWILARGGLQHTLVPVSSENLQEKITRYLDKVARQDVADLEEIQKLSEELFQLLIQPIFRYLDTGDQLCIVPDKMLNYLPFNALFSAQTGKYLLEQYDVMLSPSANTFLLCTELGKKKATVTEETVLSVGNPRFDRSQPETKDLPNLPQAEQEAKAIASFYPSHYLLLGEQAKESALRKKIGVVDVVHLATHGLPHEQTALQSKLLLAQEIATNPPEADGVLQAHEIYRLHLRQTKLVVLSACQSGIEKYYRGEGMIGLARPFLVAGVPAVVASLWAVRSEATAKLMTAFHRQRKQQSIPSLHALHLAQRELIHSAEPRYRHPYSWAAFSLIGGTTTY